MVGLARKLAAERLLNDRMDASDVAEIALDHINGAQMRKLKRVRKLVQSLGKEF